MRNEKWEMREFQTLPFELISDLQLDTETT